MKRLIHLSVSVIVLVLVLVGVSASSPYVEERRNAKLQYNILDSAPFPRTFMVLHRGQWGSNDACLTGKDRDNLLKGRSVFATLFEAQMEYGDLWKVDINGDGVCDGSDPAVIPWLEQEVQQLPLNRWGIAPTQNQLAFVHQWGYGGGGPHRDELKTFVEGCDAYWPLRTDTGDKIPWGSSSGNVTYWLTNVYVGGNTCMVDGQAQRYVDWYPNWLYTKLNGVSEWDGIRPDLMGNPHWLFGDADQDLDGCADNKHIGNSCNPFGPETAEGRQYLDTLYREGNQYMAQSIHQLFGPTRPNWVIVGGDSWMPESGDEYGFTPSGFASSGINGTINENWTTDWGATSGKFNSWPSPDLNRFLSFDFAETIRNWGDWRNQPGQTKTYIIQSKWCSNPEHVAECTNRAIAYREMRFSLAASTMLDAYHSYLHLEPSEEQLTPTGKAVPTWFDEYAVYPGNKAATTIADKQKGIGWLGWPTSEMTAINLDGTLGDTIQSALNRSDWIDYINNHAWLRYFEHGVALLNPTGGLIEAAEMPVLDGEFRRIDGTQRGYGNYTVNNGAMWVGPTKPEDALPPYDGLLLIRDEINNNVQELELTVTQDSQSGSYYHRSIYGDPPPGCAENRWCNFRHEGATLIGVDWENTSISNGVLKFTIPSEAQLTSTSHIEESRLSLYVDSNINSNPRLWIDTNIENRPLVRWYSNYGEGWATSPNLRNLISGGTDTLTFYLQSDFVESPFSFRALEYGSGEFASVLTIHYHNSGGSGEINDPTVVFQHGVDGYAGGEDTHIVTSGWESPTPHDTFPVIYLRTSRDEDEVKSSLVRFDGISLPTNAQITNAVVAFYYNGQSVNGGAINVHLSGPYPDWLAPQTTWTNFQNNQNWQVDGVKGIDDRQVYLSERVVDYTEVGSWLYFNVTNLAQQGVYEYVLHASSLGVNKDIKIPSNEYWNPALRPKLMIWCTQ